MTPEQKKKMDLFIKSNGTSCGSIWAEIAEKSWQACLDANGLDDDRFRIGEGIEYLVFGEWKSGFVGVYPAYKSAYREALSKVRRIPAWTPKDGEPVLYQNTDNKAVIGVYSEKDQCVYHGVFNGIAIPEYMKPFNAENIGRPWGEI